MDAKTRHELKQNELAAALDGLRHFDSPATRWTLVAIVAIVVLYAGWKVWAYTQARAVEGDWQRMVSITSAAAPDDPAALAATIDGLRTLIGDAANDEVRHVAQLRLARAYYSQALVDTQQRDSALAEAQRVLTDLLGSGNVKPSVLGAAYYMQGSVAESAGKFDEARQSYEKITSDVSRFDGVPFVELATGRLKTMDNLVMPATFAPGNPPAPTPAANVTTPGQGITLPKEAGVPQQLGEGVTIERLAQPPELPDTPAEAPAAEPPASETPAAEPPAADTPPATQPAEPATP